MVLSEQVVDIISQEDLSDKEFVKRLITSSEVGLAITVKSLNHQISVIADEIGAILHEEFKEETAEAIKDINESAQGKLLESMGLTKETLKSLVNPMDVPLTKNKPDGDIN